MTRERIDADRLLACELRCRALQLGLALVGQDLDRAKAMLRQARDRISQVLEASDG